MFEASLFKSPEHLISVALALRNKPTATGQYLHNLMADTQNNQKFIICTKELLLPKSLPDHTQDIIGFISQLSQIEKTKYEIQKLNTYFNSDHLLTQGKKVMIQQLDMSKDIVFRNKKFLLQKLTAEFWQPLMINYRQTYNLNWAQICHHYSLICGQQINDTDLNFLKSHKSEITSDRLINLSSDTDFYRFSTKFMDRLINESLREVHCLDQFLSELTKSKKDIALSMLVKKFVRNRGNQLLSQILIYCLRKQESKLLEYNRTMNQLRELSLSDERINMKILNCLDQPIYDILKRYREERRQRDKSILQSNKRQKPRDPHISEGKFSSKGKNNPEN